MTRVGVVALALVACAAVLVRAEPVGGEAEIGKRIYREGVLSSGAPLVSTALGDVPLPGTQASCASCHGRSGLGAGEGPALVPAVTASALFGAGIGPVREGRAPEPRRRAARVPYSPETLARALHEGVAADGRPLDRLMPRYALGAADVRHLVAYLGSLGASPPPGVDGETLRFATVVADGVDPEARAAMLEVFQAWLAAKNAETRGESARARRGAWIDGWMQQAHRHWQLDVWELRGSSGGWRAQLDAHYEAAPPFALIGGLAVGEWRTIHAFCEARELPCLFPSTDLPPEDAERDFYSLYFSRGVRLEADLVARHIEETAPTAGHVLQVRRDDPAAAAGAERLRSVVVGSHSLRERRIDTPGVPDAAFWRALVERERPAALMLWLRAPDLAGLSGAAACTQQGARCTVYLSSTLLGGALPTQAPASVRIAHPFALSGEAERSRLALQAWLRQRGVAPRAERVQADTLAALGLVRRAMKHLAGNFSREYMIETIEHQADTAHATSLYPRLSLARGQRFASKGGYVVRVAGDEPGGLAPVTPWLVP